MAWDKETEDETHQKRRQQEIRKHRLALGVSHIDESYWIKLDEKIDGIFENEESEAIQETEEVEQPEPEKKIAVLQIDEDLISSAIKEGSQRTSNIIANKKILLLNRIETVITEKEEQLNEEIAEVESQKNELKKLYERAQIEFINDRKAEREKYRSELEVFFGKIFDTVTNFSDSPTELSLICLYNRSGSVVSLNGVLSSKKVITKDEIKLGD
jgi:hypothetical protein